MVPVKIQGGDYSVGNTDRAVIPVGKSGLDNMFHFGKRIGPVIGSVKDRADQFNVDIMHPLKKGDIDDGLCAGRIALEVIDESGGQG